MRIGAFAIQLLAGAAEAPFTRAAPLAGAAETPFARTQHSQLTLPSQTPFTLPRQP
jgi:hypothetical protein